MNRNFFSLITRSLFVSMTDKSVAELFLGSVEKLSGINFELKLQYRVCVCFFFLWGVVTLKVMNNSFAFDTSLDI